MVTQEYKEIYIIVPVVALHILILELDRCRKLMTRIKDQLPYDTSNTKLHELLTAARESVSTIRGSFYAYLPGGEYDFNYD
jgi:hypothetical protein